MRAVNLLPPDTRGASKVSADLGAGPEAKGGAGPFVVLGVLAACVAGAAGYVLTDNTVKQRQADLAEVTGPASRRSQSQAAQLKPYADFDALARARVQTVKDLAGSRFDWEQALRDLSRAIPQDVTLKSLDGDIANGAGGARRPAARRDLRARDHDHRAAPPGRPQVARLMARLGDIDGVTRVSLSKSDGREVDERRRRRRRRARQRSATRLPCGTGKRPAFEVVMFFEKAAAAVATTPTTSTGAAAPRRRPTPTPDRRRPAGHDRRRRRPRRGRGDPVSRTYPHPARRGRGPRRRRRLLEARARAQARARPPARAGGRRRRRPSSPRRRA